MKPCCVFSWFWKINWQSNYAGRYLWTTYSNMSRKTFIWIIQSILNNFSNKAWENSSYTLTHLRFSLFFCYWELNIVLAKATGSAFIFIKTWDGFRNELSPKKKKKTLPMGYLYSAFNRFWAVGHQRHNSNFDKLSSHVHIYTSCCVKEQSYHN